ncbi:MAG: YaeQ family protein [Pseudomonadota bacterium]|nr:YaeQ family protein [Pseudomonadota bacterium]
MSVSTTLYRFRIDVSDIERGVYEKLDFRLAMHPSESMLYLLTRVLAFCLNTQEGLEFSRSGLSDPEGPSISANHANGRISLWIEIGNPSARKLHKAAKAAAQVKIYTYKDPEHILREAQSKEIHNSEKIEIYAFKPKFLEALGVDLPRDVRWQLLYDDQLLTISAGNKSEQTEIKRYKL